MLKLILDALDRDGKRDMVAIAATLMCSTATHRWRASPWPELVPFRPSASFRALHNFPDRYRLVRSERSFGTG